MPDLYLSLSIVGGFMVTQILMLMVRYFWDKLTGSDDRYVKKSFCKTCEKAGKDADGHLEKELKVVKGILLMMAMKMNIPVGEIQKLINDGDGR